MKPTAARLVLLVGLGALFVLLIARSTPRRVGDGGEYFAMAFNLAAGHPPALSAQDIRAAEARLAALGRPFGHIALTMPPFARGGRQDFPHF